MKRVVISILSLLLALSLMCTMCVFAGESNGDSQGENTESAGEEGESGGTGQGGNNGNSGGGEIILPEGNAGVEELVIGSYGDYPYMGSFDAFGYNTSTIAGPTAYASLVWDNLFYVYKNGDIRTDILESWEWSDDNLTLTMKLKDGIMFTNGEQMTAEDILWSLEQIVNSPSFLARNWGKIDIAGSTISEDKMTLNLHYSEVDGMTMMFLSQTPILSKAWFDANGSSWENIDVYDVSQIVGSGPYICTELQPGSYAVFQLREDYWGFAQGITWPTWKTIKGYAYTDQTTMGVDLETGKIDIATNMSTGDYERLLNGSVEGYTAYGVDSNAVIYIALSATTECLKDKRVRQAICLAVDARAIAEGIAGPLGIPATSMLATEEIGYVDGHSYEYDPVTAQQLLTEAGIQPGQIVLNYAVRTDSVQQNTAEAVKAYLSIVGIDINIVTYDTAGWYASQGNDGFTDLYWYRATGGCPSGDPGNLFTYFTTQGSLPYLVREGYDDTLLGANLTLDVEKKAELYAEFQDIIYENYDAIPLYQWLTAVGYNSQKIQSEPFGSIGYLPYMLPAAP